MWNCVWLVFNVGHGCCYAREGHTYAFPLLNHPLLPRHPYFFPRLTSSSSFSTSLMSPSGSTVPRMTSHSKRMPNTKKRAVAA